MRIAALSLIAAGAFCLAGCSDLVSLNPFVTDKQAVIDPTLLGTWISDDGKDVYFVGESGTGYEIRHASDGSDEVTSLKGNLLVSGDIKLMDVVDPKKNAFQMQVHTPVRIWIEGDTLRFAFLDSDWLRTQAAQQLAAVAAGDGNLITLPSDAVRSFFLNAGTDPKAYGEVNALHRQH